MLIFVCSCRLRSAEVKGRGGEVLMNRISSALIAFAVDVML
jgi:hypothetical protein